jgi:hypothetical protein|nr:DNA-binding protein [uncultured Dialister sp.]
MQEVNDRKYKSEMLNARDVAEILDVPVSRGYSIIRQLNKELKANGKLILRGRINKTYFYSRINP